MWEWWPSDHFKPPERHIFSLRLFSIIASTSCWKPTLDIDRIVVCFRPWDMVTKGVTNTTTNSTHHLHSFKPFFRFQQFRRMPLFSILFPALMLILWCIWQSDTMASEDTDSWIFLDRLLQFAEDHQLFDPRCWCVINVSTNISTYIYPQIGKSWDYPLMIQVLILMCILHHHILSHHIHPWRSTTGHRRSAQAGEVRRKGRPQGAGRNPEAAPWIFGVNLMNCDDCLGAMKGAGTDLPWLYLPYFMATWATNWVSQAWNRISWSFLKGSNGRW